MAVGSPVTRRANVQVRPAGPADAVAVAELLLPFEPAIPTAFPAARAGRGARAEHRLSLEAAAEHARSAEKLLRALDDVLDPKQSDAGRDLSTQHVRQRVEREQHALNQAG